MRSLASLRFWYPMPGQRFIAGVALSAGTRSFTYEDRLYVMPIDRLWTPVG